MKENFKFSNGRQVEFMKKPKNIIIIYRKYRTLFRCLYRNLAQKLDTFVQIVKITGHAWQRKVVPGRQVITNRAFTRQIGNPRTRVTLALR